MLRNGNLPWLVLGSRYFVCVNMLLYFGRAWWEWLMFVEGAKLSYISCGVRYALHVYFGDGC